MEKPKLDWKTFAGRRRLNVSAWIASKGFKNLDELNQWCVAQGMEPPKSGEVSFPAPVVVMEEPEVAEMAEVSEEEEKPKNVRRGRPKRVDEASE